ncbi:MAG: rod shape-determining protein MreC [Thermodesulfovibrio sp.]|nr:rod shape-determining protein MreC [Thermodesulfovibrio sp.]
MLRKKALLLIVIIAAFILMTYQGKKGTIGSLTSLNALLQTAQHAVSSVTDSLSRPFRTMALREEDNTRLRKRVDQLLLEQSANQEATLENKRLKDLLKLRDTHRNYITAARVISRGIGHWEHTLVLDKGLKDGIVRDMTVMTPLGLAGKITSVSESYATMLWISDINFSAAVRTREGRHEAVLSGTGSRLCLLKYMPYEEEVKPGDVVITSGFDAFFPPGIPVGYVSKIDTRGIGGNFQYIEITPFQDAAKLEEVIIVR